MILIIKYEDLNRYTLDTTKKIMDFHNIKTNNDYFSSLASTKLTKEKNLKNELSKGSIAKFRSTARKAAIGDWKIYFNNQHKEKFKK